MELIISRIRGGCKMEKQVPVFNTGLHDLYPLFCGYEDCCHSHSFGPAVREYFLIHFIKKGQGVFTRGKKEYPLSKGQCFLIQPNEVTIYQADRDKPWTYIWIAFNGESAGGFIKSAGLDENPVFGNDRISAAFDRLRAYIFGSPQGSGKNEFAMLSILYAIFDALPQKSADLSQRELYVKMVRNYVGNMAAGAISVERLASFCGLDRHYLCRVFKEQTGLTLQEYVIDFRMKKARQLLLYTSLAVGEVAHSVGYTDAYNFSKMFKKYNGMSPLNFRNSPPLDAGAKKT